MPAYEITAPDGHVLSVNAPDGTTQDQVLAYVQNSYKPQPTQSPQERANAAGVQAGHDQSPLTAAIGQASQQGTAGLANYVNAGVRYMGQRLTGVPNPDDYITDLSYSRGISQGEAEGHPLASTLGGTGGALLGAAALRGANTALRGGEVAAATPGIASRLAGGAATGGALGGIQSQAQGQDLPTTLLNAAGGAVMGGGLAGVVPAITQRLTPAAMRAWSLLASKLNVKPADLLAAANTHEMATGATPNMGQLMGFAQQGTLRKLAQVNPELAAAARTAADQGGAPLHVQLQAANAGGATRPQNAIDLSALRDAQMTAAMSEPHPVTGTALRDEPVPDPTGVLTAPHVDYAMRPNATVNARLNQASPVLDRISQGSQTVSDIDTVRRALRDQQANFLRDAPGGMHAKDPAIAGEFGDLATQVEQLGTAAHPEYGTALEDMRNAGHYIRGFEHGLSGADALTPRDTDTAASLLTPSGIGGYNHGQALAVGQRALDAIAPPSLQPPTSLARRAAHTAAAVGSGGLSTKAYHVALAALVGDRVSPAAQQIIAKQLFDPATVRQGIAGLRRAKATEQQIRDFAAGIGGVAGSAITNNLLTTRSPQQ